jgi:hypothetical protein
MALLAIVLVESDLIAQAPPRPNVVITKYPTLESNLWPADFNRDGRTDIVAGRSIDRTGDLIVRLGAGNGTFGTERVVASAMSPVTVGDFNGDARIDIVAVGPERSSDGTADLYILGGRGDGTFLPPLAIAGGVSHGWNFNGMTADFNGDGRRDLAVMGHESDQVRIFPGNGDLTFGPHMSLQTSIFSRQFIVANLNADTLPDIAVATQYSRAVDVFLNSGGLLFSHTTIQFDRAALGITAWDMNVDGRSDLIVTTGEEFIFQGDTFESGEVNVLLGRGDGTFDAPMTFPTGNGPMTAAAGDFNRDGIVDVATGNWTEQYDGRCDSFAFLWDSISILPGLGGGRLGAPASFALGNTARPPGDTAYRRQHHALKTSDLNGDGRTDLIASPGVVLLNAAPSATRPPVANAGEDQQNVPPNPGPGGTVLNGTATDPDNDWLTWEWRDQAGTLLGSYPRACFYEEYHGRQTFTLTVRDGRGGVGTDTVTYTFGNVLPEGWSSRDIGAVGAAGSSEFSGGGYTVRGSGTDIWGTADEFHFAHTAMDGNFEFTARVPYVQNVNQWTKAGLMIRDALTPGARHASLFATPTTVKGVAFQRRATTGGTSVHTAGPAAAPPVWLRLRREGNSVRAFSRTSDSAPWTLIGTQTFTALPASLYVGLAVSSHVDGTLAEAWFENVTLEAITAPSTFQSNDIGAVGASGSSSTNGTTYTVTGSGADVWGTADEFHFFSRSITGDFDFSARAASVQNVNSWTKAGLMLRDGLAANARHAFVIATPTTTKGIAFQRRATTGGTSVHTAGPAVAPPQWLRLTRVGNVVTAYHRSSSTAAWTAIGSQTFSSLPATMRVGFATSSHVDGTRATATFDNVTITP